MAEMADAVRAGGKVSPMRNERQTAHPMLRAATLAVLLSLSWVATAAAELPAAFRGWQSGTAETISMPQLASAAGANAAVVREYGFLGAERRAYTRNGMALTVTLWRMQDATGSFGLFSFLSEPGMSGETAGEDAIALGSGILFLQSGPYLLEARGEGVSLADGTELGASIAKAGGVESLLPPHPIYLPQEGLIPHSQTFLIGPVAFARAVDRIPAAAVGFQNGAEAIQADYRTGSSTTRLLLITYPTPQMAAKMFDSFQELPTITRNEPGKTLFVERKSSLIAFVMDAPSLAAAEKLLDQVNYESNLTWNEYVPPRGENVGTMMMALFSLAGIILLGAFVAGIAFGGVRVLAKRFLPKAVFDRPSQTEIIQLNLTEK